MPSNDAQQLNGITASQSLGPRMWQFLTSCYDADPKRFSFMWASGAIAMVVTLSIAYTHRAEMSRRPASLKRMYYQHVNLFAPVLGVAATISLFCPRDFLMMKMCQELTEAFVLSAFGNVLFLLCAEEACLTDTTEDDYSKGASVAVKMLAALNEEGEKPHFAVPPFACCFTKCMPKHLLTPGQMVLARNFIRQYAIIVGAGSVLSLWCGLSLSMEQASFLHSWVGRVSKLSAFVCIYGLFILYKATHHLLEKWHPTAKFVSLKLVVGLMAFQEILVSWAVQHFPSASDECLADTSVGGEAGEEIQNKFRERFNSMYLVALESILVAFLVRRAFPASDLQEQSLQMHGMLLELDFEQMAGDRSRLGLESEGESSGSDAS